MAIVHLGIDLIQGGKMAKIKVESSLVGNKYSQWGEESAIRQILAVIGKEAPNLVHVEFGASQGTDNSNLFAFAEEGSQVVFIESDPKKYSVLETRISSLPSAKALCAHVASIDTGEPNRPISSRFVGTLSTILARAGVDLSRVGVVSIDIDGDDSLVFENLGLNALVVICEFNPTLPIDSHFRNPLGASFGNSPLDLIRVGADRGMFPVAVTHTNLIFVSNDFRSDFEQLNLVEQMSSGAFPRFGFGYDGTLIKFLSDGKDVTEEYYTNIWSSSVVIQPLPRFLRSHTHRGKIFLGFLYSSLIAVILRPVVVFSRFGRLVSALLRGRN